MLCPEELAAVTTAAAIALSKGRCLDEIELLAVVFAQLGDTLATIATQRSIIESRCCKEEGESSSNLPRVNNLRGV